MEAMDQSYSAPLKMEIRTHAEQHIEVHKFRAGAVVAVAVAALLLQAFLPAHLPRVGEFMELPLLVTIYFGLSRRNPSTGLLLGTVIGLVQDSLSSGRSPIGLYGISKTLVGFFASSIGARIDTEHPVGRFVLTFAFFHFHHASYALTQRMLLSQRESFITWPLLLASLVNAVLAVALFPLLDKLRKHQ
jgi:rod shape-determining protein MreD